MAFEKKPNCKFTCAQVIQMMILFPFFSIKNAANYFGSSLQSLFDCRKDMFYRVLSNDRIDWRHILRYVNKKLAKNIAVRSEARFNKKRDAESKVEKRKEEYCWFTCKEVVNYIRRKGSKSHLIGMIKMSKTKYSINGEDMTAKAIASAMVRKKAVKYSRAHKFYYFETDAVFAGNAVKLFFYRFGRKGEWKALLSPDTSLTPYKAYQIYSMRWSIEVSFHECKSILKMGKCQCRDFGSQIASISLNMLQYNLLSYVKRFESYETIGGLFREITAQTLELSVTEKIWGLIQQIVAAVADFFSADFDELLTNIINENKQLNAIMRVAQQLQTAA